MRGRTFHTCLYYVIMGIGGGFPVHSPPYRYACGCYSLPTRRVNINRFTISSGAAETDVTRSERQLAMTLTTTAERTTSKH